MGSRWVKAGLIVLAGIGALWVIGVVSLRREARQEERRHG